MPRPPFQAGPCSRLHRQPLPAAARLSLAAPSGGVLPTLLLRFPRPFVVDPLQLIRVDVVTELVRVHRCKYPRPIDAFCYTQ